MLLVLFLICVLFIGYVIASYFEVKNNIVRLGIAFCFGSIFSISFIYFLTSYVFKQLYSSIIAFIICTFLLALLHRKKIFKKLLPQMTLSRLETLVFIIVFSFSYYLFNKSFSFDQAHNSFLIASNVYLDFGAHIPFIRSFSLGKNFPSEVPFFANKGLIYYFLFDFYTGILEFLGLRIDIAYNLLSSFSFTLLILFIYKLGHVIFKNTSIGFLSVFLFLFSSNLSYTVFFQKFGIQYSTISNFWHNNFFFEGFPTPFNKVLEIARFWNLNPYTNQRHLVFGILFTLVIVYILLSFIHKKRVHGISIILLGLGIGLFPFWHVMMFVAIYLLLAAFFIFYPNLRINIIKIFAIGFVIAGLEIYAIKIHSQNSIIFQPGFLISNQLTVYNFFMYWFINLGLTLPAVLYSLLKISNEKRKLFLIFMILFVFPNIFHLSTRFIFDDHKFFNLWIIFMNYFAACALVYINKRWIFGKIFFVIFFILMTMSGYLSFLVIKNDVYTTIIDYKNNSFMEWAQKSISSNELILTNGEIYDPMSMIGKKIFLGRSHYIFVYGGDVNQRSIEKSILLSGKNINKIRTIISNNTIKYVIFYKDNFAKNSTAVDLKFYEQYFNKIYEDEYASVFRT